MRGSFEWKCGLALFLKLLATFCKGYYNIFIIRREFADEEFIKNFVQKQIMKSLQLASAVSHCSPF